MHNWKHINTTYIYDGSFDGLLCIVFDSYINKTIPENIVCNDYCINLFNTYKKITTDYEKSKRIYNGIVKNVSYKTLYYSYNVFLSNEKDKELIIYYFLLNSLKYQKNVLYMRNLKCVNKALTISNRVSREAHKWKGFLRFKEMQNNIFFAEFNADNNILGILANHFKKRLPKEKWVIKDEKRDILCLYDQKNCYFLEGKEIKLDLNINNEEKNMEELWKSFFKTIAIKERVNKKCQQNFMPKKYWPNILEMEDEQ